jgi:hypothetical protein
VRQFMRALRREHGEEAEEAEEGAGSASPSLPRPPIGRAHGQVGRMIIVETFARARSFAASKASRVEMSWYPIFRAGYQWARHDQDGDRARHLA